MERSAQCVGDGSCALPIVMVKKKYGSNRVCVQKLDKHRSGPEPVTTAEDLF